MTTPTVTTPVTTTPDTKSGYGLEFGVQGLEAVAVPQVING